MVVWTEIDKKDKHRPFLWCKGRVMREAGISKPRGCGVGMDFDEEPEVVEDIEAGKARTDGEKEVRCSVRSRDVVRVRGKFRVTVSGGGKVEQVRKSLEGGLGKEGNRGSGGSD